MGRKALYNPRPVSRTVRDDQVAMHRLYDFIAWFPQSGYTRTEIGSQNGLSASAIGRLLLYPEECSVRVYNTLAHTYGWEAYESNRRVPDAAKGQLTLAFKQVPDNKSEVQSVQEVEEVKGGEEAGGVETSKPQQARKELTKTRDNRGLFITMEDQLRKPVKIIAQLSRRSEEQVVINAVAKYVRDNMKLINFANYVENMRVQVVDEVCRDNNEEYSPSEECEEPAVLGETGGLTAEEWERVRR